MNPAPLPIAAGPPAPLPDRIRAAIGRRADHFADAASRVRGESDPEALHDVRVSARRLTGALGLWRDALRAKPVRRARQRLRTLRRAVGAPRELEVHIADLSQRLRDQPLALRLVGADLLDILRRDAERGRTRAIARCGEARITRILRDVRRALAGLDAPDATGTAMTAGAQARADAAGRTARESITTALAAPGDEALHQARIAIKQWRYAIEALGPSDLAPPITPAMIRPLQEALGVVQDRATLRARIDQFAAELRDRGLLVHAEALRPLALELEAERREGVDQFMRLAAALFEAPDAAAPDAAPATSEPDASSPTG